MKSNMKKKRYLTFKQILCRFWKKNKKFFFSSSTLVNKMGSTLTPVQK